MKGLEAYENVLIHLKQQYFDFALCEKELKTIEKELKALEIIRSFHFYLRVGEFVGIPQYYLYDNDGHIIKCMSKKEYAILEEVFKNE